MLCMYFLVLYWHGFYALCVVESTCFACPSPVLIHMLFMSLPLCCFAQNAMPNIVFRILFTSFLGNYSKCYSQHCFLGKQFLTLHSELYSGSHAPNYSSHSHIVFKYYFPKMLCSQYNPQDNITLSPILFPNIILRRGFYIIFWDNMKVAFILYSNITPAVSLVYMVTQKYELCQDIHI